MPEEVTVWRGGSFAPPLGPGKLENYLALAEKAPQPVKAAMKRLAEAVAAHHDVPAEARKAGKGGNDKVGAGHEASPKARVVMMAPKHCEAVNRAMPYPHEVHGIQRLFDDLPPGDVRDAAFHLLWYVRELELGRHPITNDLL